MRPLTFDLSLGDRRPYFLWDEDLAGFHLGHRVTDDLDLFTPDVDAFQRTRFVLDDAARAVGATLEVRQAARRHAAD